MQIIIDIPEKEYNIIKKSTAPMTWVEHLIKNGTPLPKGHGRIADMYAAIKYIEDAEGEEAIWAIGLIDWACSKRTIIEADKRGKDASID